MLKSPGDEELVQIVILTRSLNKPLSGTVFKTVRPKTLALSVGMFSCNSQSFLGLFFSHSTGFSQVGMLGLSMMMDDMGLSVFTAPWWLDQDL